VAESAVMADPKQILSRDAPQRGDFRALSPAAGEEVAAT